MTLTSIRTRSFLKELEGLAAKGVRLDTFEVVTEVIDGIHHTPNMACDGPGTDGYAPRVGPLDLGALVDLVEEAICLECFASNRFASLSGDSVFETIQTWNSLLRALGRLEDALTAADVEEVARTSSTLRAAARTFYGSDPGLFLSDTSALVRHATDELARRFELAGASIRALRERPEVREYCVSLVFPTVGLAGQHLHPEVSADTSVDSECLGALNTLVRAQRRALAESPEWVSVVVERDRLEARLSALGTFELRGDALALALFTDASGITTAPLGVFMAQQFPVWDHTPVVLHHGDLPVEVREALAVLYDPSSPVYHDLGVALTAARAL